MVCLIFKGILTNNQESIPPKTLDDIGKHRFSREFSRVFFRFFPHFSSIFSPFFPCFPQSVTLVTAKKQHCGWNARAYACTRETLTENSPSTIFLIFPSSSFLLSWFLLFSFLTSLSSFFLLLSSCFLRSLSLSPSSLLGRVIQYFKISYLLFLYCSFGVIQRGKCSFPRFLHALGQYLPIYK